MEIFNSIWTALSTPNEGLLNILLIPAALIENFLMILLYSSIQNIKFSTKKILTYVFSMSLFSLLNMSLIPNPFNIILNYLIMIIIAYLLFRISFLRSSISMLLSAIFFNLIGALILNPYITFLNINTEQLSNIPIYRIPYILIMYTLVSLIIFILKYRRLKINFLDTLNKNTKYMLFANLILGFITLSVQTIIAVYYTDKLPIIITFLSFISLLAYFILSIYSLTRAFKLTLTTQKLESAEEYNNTLRILHDNVRGFKHDFDNIVTTIGGYIKTEDMEGLRNYYLQLEDDCQRVNNLYILNPEVVNNDGIYNLLTKKYYEAESKDIKVNITFLLDLSTLNMKIYEFARILGILLDNAIEASSECEEKIINIVFRNDPNNFRQLVLIENTFNDKDLDTDKIFEKGISGKENHTGLGLWEVRKLIKKNSNINLYTSKSDKYFSQQLEIYYK